MFRPISLYIGLRYSRARKSSQLLSFVSLISTFGVSLGVLALIVVLSVINAATSTMREEMLKSVPHASMNLPADSDPLLLGAALEQSPGIIATAPYIQAEAWIRYEGAGYFVTLRGVDPERELAVTHTGSDPALQELLNRLSDNPGGAILGGRLASRMGVYQDDPVNIITLNSLLNRQTANSRNIRVIGSADFGFYGSDDIILVNLADARQLLAADGIDSASRLRLRVSDVMQASSLVQQAMDQLESGMAVGEFSTWEQDSGSLFAALRLEKIMTTIMLMMIVVIGVVNIVSTLAMAVADKSADIAILRTMGAGRTTIMGVFIIQGLTAGLLGTLLGVALGVLLTVNLDGVLRVFEYILSEWLFPDDVYMMSHFGAELRWSDVGLVSVCAIAISLLATVYPAWRASRIQPAEVLRYE